MTISRALILLITCSNISLVGMEKSLTRHMSGALRHSSAAFPAASLAVASRYRLGDHPRIVMTTRAEISKFNKIVEKRREELTKRLRKIQDELNELEAMKNKHISIENMVGGSLQHTTAP